MTRADILEIMSPGVARHPYASDLLAFLDSQRVTIGPPIRNDGSGWLVSFDFDAFDVKAWGPTSDGQPTRLAKRCSTLTEALQAIHAYEQMLPA